MKKLQNKIAVITGADNGMGLSIAILFAEPGARVVITARNHTSLNCVSTICNEATGITGDLPGLNSI